MDKLIIKPKMDFRIRSGHPWVFSNEIAEHLKIDTGSVVRVVSSSGYDYGLAFYNPHSLVAARLLYIDDVFDRDTIRNRIMQAFQYRKTVLPDENSFRMVFGESDFLPGLIVDKYEDYLSVQFLSCGIDNLKNEVVESLIDVLPNTLGIIEKDLSSHRKTEGLPEIETVLFGSIPDKINITENSIRLSVDLSGGQKTGYFLDQKINRRFLKSISKDKTVLDCFCNQGGFALNAASAGAKLAVGVDISDSAVQAAKYNAQINDFQNTDFAKADVFEYLEKQVSEANCWDIVVLDPPAFTKNRKTLPKAKAGYAKINRLALKIINNGGFLVSSSCSHHISEIMFLEIISKEAAKLNKNLRIVFRGAQSPDHPILASMPETNYIKFFVFQVS